MISPPSPPHIVIPFNGHPGMRSMPYGGFLGVSRAWMFSTAAEAEGEDASFEPGVARVEAAPVGVGVEVLEIE